MNMVQTGVPGNGGLLNIPESNLEDTSLHISILLLIITNDMQMHNTWKELPQRSPEWVNYYIAPVHP